MELAGTFAPPSMGNTSVPIPMVGQGTLKITDAGLEASGSKKPFNPLVLLIPVAVIAGIIFFAVVATALNLPSGASRPIGAGIVGAILFFALRRNNKVSKNAKPWTLSIPWSSVKKVQEDPQMRGALMIHVKKFKPSGTLHFAPATKVSILELMADLERRSSKAA